MVKRITVLTLFALLLTLGISAVVSAQFTPEVFVVDQPVIDSTVRVSRAVINEPGWIVIHADNGGTIGPVIGHAPLMAGINAQIKISVDAEGVTDTLYAMLHIDAGEAGVYEFPDGADVPLLVNDAPVTPAFSVTSVENTVVGTAINADGFSTLVAAIEAAGLVETLQGEGPFTVFAPTDDAFAALPEGTLDSLLADPEALGNILLYHVIQDSALAGDLEDGMSLDSIQGSPLTIALNADGAKVNDANIVVTDIEAYNGVIHVIDAVLLPPAPEEEAAVEEEAPADEETGDAADIVDTAIAAGDFTTLVAAVEAAGLVDTLKSEGPFTVFAPTDDAFAALPEGTLDALLADPEALANILLYHVVPGSVLSTDLSDGMEAETAQGAMVTFSITDGTVMVNDATVVAADIAASNGVIHVIDTVILPPAADEEEMAPEEEAAPEEEMGANDIVSVAAGADDFSTLVTALNAAGLVGTLQGDGPFTVFAPTNDAFAALPDGALSALLADREALINVLLYHVASGTLLSSDITDGLSVTTIQGSEVLLGVSGDGVTVNGANVVIADIAASNGVIHAIDAVLLPSAVDPAPEPTATAAPIEPIATAAPAVPTPTPEAPVTMPETGLSLGNGSATLPVVSLVLFGLIGVALLERRKR